MFSGMQWSLALLAIAAVLLINYLLRVRPRSGLPQHANASQENKGDWFDDLVVGYLEIDSEGIVRRVNPAGCQLRGVLAQEALGKHCADLEPPSSREQCRQALVQKLADQVPLTPYERKFLRSDGTVVTAEVHEALVRDKGGHVIGLRSLTMDVTNRKGSEEQASETACMLKALFQAFPDLFLQLDARGIVVECKSGNGRDPWLASETFLGRRLQDILPADAARLLSDATDKVWRTNSLEVVEYSTCDQQNQQFYECRVVPLYWDHTVIVVRNATERKL